MLEDVSKLINIQIPPYPEYSASSYRSFLQNEKHITRVCNEFVIIFMIDRTLYFIEDGQDISVNNGEWYIQVPGFLQEGRVGSPAPYYYYIHFNTPNYSLCNKELLYSKKLSEKKEKGESIYLPVRGSFNIGKFKPLFDKLNSYDKLCSKNIIAKQVLFLSIFEKLIEASYPIDKKEDKLELQLLDYLSNNYSTIFSCEELEEKFYFSIDYLTRRVKKHCGVTPWQYVQQLRVEKAKELLINSDYTMSFIASSVGYNDVSVFYKAFRKYTKVSPGSWREKYRGLM
jgi:AraC-like DNA-binding protein